MDELPTIIVGMRVRLAQVLRRRRVCLPGLLAGLLLAGCATQAPAPLPAHMPPTAGPQANLLVEVLNTDDRYVVSTFEEAGSCSGRLQIAAGTQRDPERMSTRIAAGRVQTLAVYFEAPNQRQGCEVLVSFEPHSGKTYVMRNARDTHACTLSVREVDAAGDRLPVRIVQRERRGSHWPDNACTRMTTAALESAASGDGPGSIDDYRDLLPKP